MTYRTSEIPFFARDDLVGMFFTISNETTVIQKYNRNNEQVPVIQLFGHEIAEYPDRDTVALSDAGWQTVTTKQRLNRLLPEPYTIFQKNHEWFLWERDTDAKIEWDSNTWHVFKRIDGRWSFQWTVTKYRHELVSDVIPTS